MRLFKKGRRENKGNKGQVTFCEACGRVCDSSCLAEATYRHHRDAAILTTSRKIV